MVRTRSDAAALAKKGHVRVNGERIKTAARPVRIDDVVTVSLDQGVRVVRVRGFSIRRGSASDAAVLFENVEAPQSAS